MLEIFSKNSKTVLSLDFSRENTCPQICSYCYVEKTEKFRPDYLPKIKRNHKLSDNPVEFANSLNTEYMSLRKSKQSMFNRLDKIPVRIYGSGDFIPKHIEFLKRLDFKFFILSKSLTMFEMVKHIDKLLEIKNLTNIILSFDNQNIMNYSNIEKYFNRNKTGISFTGLSDDFNDWKNMGLKFNIFFNVKKTREEERKASRIKEQCPCDSRIMELKEVCTKCSKCWRSSITKKKGWNNHGEFT